MENDFTIPQSMSNGSDVTEQQQTGAASMNPDDFERSGEGVKEGGNMVYYLVDLTCVINAKWPFKFRPRKSSSILHLISGNNSVKQSFTPELIRHTKILPSHYPSKKRHDFTIGLFEKSLVEERFASDKNNYRYEFKDINFKLFCWDISGKGTLDKQIQLLNKLSEAISKFLSESPKKRHRIKIRRQLLESPAFTPERPTVQDIFLKVIAPLVIKYVLEQLVLSAQIDVDKFKAALHDFPESCLEIGDTLSSWDINLQPSPGQTRVLLKVLPCVLDTMKDNPFVQIILDLEKISLLIITPVIMPRNVSNVILQINRFLEDLKKLFPDEITKQDDDLIHVPSRLELLIHLFDYMCESLKSNQGDLDKWLLKVNLEKNECFNELNLNNECNQNANNPQHSITSSEGDNRSVLNVKNTLNFNGNLMDSNEVKINSVRPSKRRQKHRKNQMRQEREAGGKRVKQSFTPELIRRSKIHSSHYPSKKRHDFTIFEKSPEEERFASDKRNYRYEFKDINFKLFCWDISGKGALDKQIQQFNKMYKAEAKFLSKSLKKRHRIKIRRQLLESPAFTPERPTVQDIFLKDIAPLVIKYVLEQLVLLAQIDVDKFKADLHDFPASCLEIGDTLSSWDINLQPSPGQTRVLLTVLPWVLDTMKDNPFVQIIVDLEKISLLIITPVIMPRNVSNVILQINRFLEDLKKLFPDEITKQDDDLIHVPSRLELLIHLFDYMCESLKSNQGDLDKWLLKVNLEKNECFNELNLNNECNQNANNPQHSITSSEGDNRSVLNVKNTLNFNGNLMDSNEVKINSVRPSKRRQKHRKNQMRQEREAGGKRVKQSFTPELIRRSKIHSSHYPSKKRHDFTIFEKSPEEERFASDKRNYRYEFKDINFKLFCWDISGKGALDKQIQQFNKMYKAEAKFLSKSLKKRHRIKIRRQLLESPAFTPERPTVQDIFLKDIAPLVIKYVLEQLVLLAQIDVDKFKADLHDFPASCLEIGDTLSSWDINLQPSPGQTRVLLTVLPWVLDTMKDNPFVQIIVDLEKISLLIITPVIMPRNVSNVTLQINRFLEDLKKLFPDEITKQDDDLIHVPSRLELLIHLFDYMCESLKSNQGDLDKWLLKVNLEKNECFNELNLNNECNQNANDPQHSITSSEGDNRSVLNVKNTLNFNGNLMDSNEVKINSVRPSKRRQKHRKNQMRQEREAGGKRVKQSFTPELIRRSKIHSSHYPSKKRHDFTIFEKSPEEERFASDKRNYRYEFKDINFKLFCWDISGKGALDKQIQQFNKMYKAEAKFLSKSLKKRHRIKIRRQLLESPAFTPERPTVQDIFLKDIAPLVIKNVLEQLVLLAQIDVDKFKADLHDFPASCLEIGDTLSSWDINLHPSPGQTRVLLTVLPWVLDTMKDNPFVQIILDLEKISLLIITPVIMPRNVSNVILQIKRFLEDLKKLFPDEITKQDDDLIHVPSRLELLIHLFDYMCESLKSNQGDLDKWLLKVNLEKNEF
ncbi:uncharacterized protein LOC130382752 isoform X2 [Gadus chalcogrammus]|uniref:uncharacterized protein LOC130382752 isoform X2 n=1 Tax=Gadus chalcogrammus TaxID=1042646 RepID=UPI0024C276CC|nr:uncharacterized protein LOC130382752 isoform X2 [Gadus chalcogrammus]XP_056446616.1 uncharacterized protein LOC130382752 isoform X2 [Gadus chalcogrammus]XP_056446617.1 uncharacterized protein LOC130382752 isoform X2 [Gadus chalcogrammus]XP_056446618.1 uncharacterized protein LOC130382752 isoform X2 [Gadus chalcogrammus]